MAEATEELFAFPDTQARRLAGGIDEIRELTFATVGREIYFQHPDGSWEGDRDPIRSSSNRRSAWIRCGPGSHGPRGDLRKRLAGSSSAAAVNAIGHHVWRSGRQTTHPVTHRRRGLRIGPGVPRPRLPSARVLLPAWHLTFLGQGDIAAAGQQVAVYVRQRIVIQLQQPDLNKLPDRAAPAGASHHHRRPGGPALRRASARLSRSLPCRTCPPTPGPPAFAAGARSP